MNAKALKTPSSWAKAIVDTLIAQNIQIDPILKSLNIDKEKLNDRDGVIDQDTVTDLWDAAVNATGNHNIGFDVGKEINTVLSPIVAYSLMSCSNLKSSCDRLLRYQDILAEGLKFEMRETSCEFELVFDILPSTKAPSPQAIKSAIAGFFSFARWVTRSKVQPIQASLIEPKPVTLETYQTLFTCPINFNAKENCLYFSKQDLLEPLPTADTSLSEIHEQHLQSYREKLHTPTFTEQVNTILRNQLPSGEPNQAIIASSLNVSSSTLKRRLKEQGTTYKTLLDTTRHQLAIEYLAQKKLSLTDITYLLGFSQSSAFTRAFKRWENVSPKNFKGA